MARTVVNCPKSDQTSFILIQSPSPLISYPTSSIRLKNMKFHYLYQQPQHPQLPRIFQKLNLTFLNQHLSYIDPKICHFSNIKINFNFPQKIIDKFPQTTKLQIIQSKNALDLHAKIHVHEAIHAYSSVFFHFKRKQARFCK